VENIETFLFFPLIRLFHVSISCIWVIFLIFAFSDVLYKIFIHNFLVVVVTDRLVAIQIQLIFEDINVAKVAVLR